MRTETLWQGERRAARMHWWRQMVDPPTQADWNEVFDEMVVLRFRVGEDRQPLFSGEKNRTCRRID